MKIINEWAFKSQIDNSFFYKKDRGPNENVEKEVNHLISKSKSKARKIYILQILQYVLIILCIYFFPFNFYLDIDSLDKRILYMLIFSLSLGGIISLIILMMFAIVETDEYDLLSNKRGIKGIIEVLQDYFYESPFKAFDVSNNYDYKSWIEYQENFV